MIAQAPTPPIGFTRIDDTSDGLKSRVRGEYLEMPGLQLSPEQATRLWGLDRATCGKVLDDLVGTGFLQRDRSGRYMRRTGGY